MPLLLFVLFLFCFGLSCLPFPPFFSWHSFFFVCCFVLWRSGRGWAGTCIFVLSRFGVLPSSRKIKRTTLHSKLLLVPYTSVGSLHDRTAKTQKKKTKCGNSIFFSNVTWYQVAVLYLEIFPSRACISTPSPMSREPHANGPRQSI